MPPSGWIAYWVQRSDTINALALRTYSNAANLIRANCLANPDQITTGQLIYLPRNPLPPTPTSTAVPTSAGCSDALPARLSISAHGRVTPGNPNSLRTGPDTVGTTIIGQIPGGGQFIVINGPACGAGMRWWQVKYNGQFGWTPEGQGTVYWLEPFVPVEECVGILPTRLQVGGAGRVPFGKRGPLYAQPIPDLNDLNAVIGVIPDNGHFTVLAGPTCVNNQMRWWKVNYGGAVGWTIEATPTLYWLEPAASGMRWWRVESGSLIGWTPEGQGTTYWLEPL